VFSLTLEPNSKEKAPGELKQLLEKVEMEVVTGNPHLYGFFIYLRGLFNILSVLALCFYCNSINFKLMDYQ
jgi:hypothetical protein